MLGIKRREFITVLGGSMAWPLAARGEQPTMPIWGTLSQVSFGCVSLTLGAF